MQTKMATLRMLHILCRKCRKIFASQTPPRVQYTRQKPSTNVLGATLLVSALCQAKPKFDFQAPDSSKLTPEYLLKAGTDQTADSVIVLISQIEFAILETEHKYTETMKTMVKLLDHHLTVLGNREEEDAVWDVILQGRDRLQTCGKKLEELLLLFTFVQKLTRASIETASLTGCEESNLHLQERLRNAEERLDKSHEQKHLIQKQLQEIEAHSIKVIAEHAEEEKKKSER